MSTQDIDPGLADASAEDTSLRMRAAEAIAVGIGLFVFYTSFFGAFETLIQRASFVALIVVMAVLLYPTGKDKGWRGLGIVIDVAMALWVIGSAIYVIANFERIMVQLPFAEPIDAWLGFGTLLVIL